MSSSSCSLSLTIARSLSLSFLTRSMICFNSVSRSSWLSLSFFSVNASSFLDASISSSSTFIFYRYSAMSCSSKKSRLLKRVSKGNRANFQQNSSTAIPCVVLVLKFRQKLPNLVCSASVTISTISRTYSSLRWASSYWTTPAPFFAFYPSGPASSIKWPSMRCCASYLKSLKNASLSFTPSLVSISGYML